MTDFVRQPGETEEHFIWRIGQARDNGELDLSWDEIAEVINRTFREDESAFMDSSRYRKMYQSARRFWDAGVFESKTDDKHIDVLQDCKRELQKERIKLQTEKLEYNRWLREDARDEMLAEKFSEAIAMAPKIEFPEVRVLHSARDKRSGVLAFADCHYGCEFTIYGLRGEIINAYSPEIFETRMEELLQQVLSLVDREELTELRVYELGDSTDGLLRVGQLMKLRYGVVEQAVYYANYLANWLNELSKHVRVKFQMVFGNHTELRFFNQKKGSFKDENTGLFIRELIKARLDGNQNFEMEVTPSGLIYDEVQGYNVVGLHGEVSNMGQALKDFTITFHTDIDILIGAHKHHLMEETVGVDKEVITVPSIIGIDDYSLSLNKTSRPGASLFIVEKDYGVTTEHRIKL